MPNAPAPVAPELLELPRAPDVLDTSAELDEIDDTPMGMESMKLNQSKRLHKGTSDLPILPEMQLVEARRIASHLWQLSVGWVFMQYCVHPLHSRRWQLCVAAMLIAPVLACMLLTSPLWAVWIWSSDSVDFSDAFWWAVGRLSWSRLSLPPAIDNDGAEPSRRNQLSGAGVARSALCRYVRQWCSCGAHVATRQQRALGIVHRNCVADSAGTQCGRLSMYAIAADLAWLGNACDSCYLCTPQHGNSSCRSTLD
jgi:hypothetical protein